MKTEIIVNKPIREKIYDRLKEKIFLADILPGQVVTLNGLAKEFGVSLMPVREALWQLEATKAIVIKNYTGIRINALTAEEMREALELRLILESRAAEIACEKRTDSTLIVLKHILEKMTSSVRTPAKYMSLNKQFHFTLYSHANSPMLLQLIDFIWTRVGPYLFMKASKGGDTSLPVKCHQGMYRSLVDKDKKQMVYFLRKDLAQAADFIIPLLPRETGAEGLR